MPSHPDRVRRNYQDTEPEKRVVRDPPVGEAIVARHIISELLNPGRLEGYWEEWHPRHDDKDE